MSNFLHLTWRASNAGFEVENLGLLSERKLEKKFGQSPVFVASTLLEDGGTLKSATPASLLREAIHVISCGYEDKTEWGKEVTTMFGFLCCCSQIFQFSTIPLDIEIWVD